MNIKKTYCATALFAISFGVAAAIDSAQGQGSCSLGQDEIVAEARLALEPGSGLLRASPGRLGSAAAGIAAANQGCALDVVVALGTIRPDAADEVAQAVTGVFPEQEFELLAVGAQLGEGLIEPAAGGLGPIDDVFDADSLYDSGVRGDDAEQRGASPG